MYNTIRVRVRADVLAAFDASLTEGETRDELIAALIHLEATSRHAGHVAADGSRGSGRHETIDIVLDHAQGDGRALGRALRPHEVTGAFITALMLRSVRRQIVGTVHADDPLPART